MPIRRRMLQYYVKIVIQMFPVVSYRTSKTIWETIIRSFPTGNIIEINAVNLRNSSLLYIIIFKSIDTLRTSNIVIIMTMWTV